MAIPVHSTIKRLGAEDARVLVGLRRLALETAPHAFESGPGDDRLEDPAFLSRMLEDPRQAVFGAYHEALVGTVGIAPGTHRKTAHRLDVWGLFVDPAYRGRGLGRGLMEAALGFARSFEAVTSVHLSVTDRAPEAQALYRSLGFVTWGVEPDAIRLPGMVISEVHMVLRLR